jgi:endonuclease/exonuclease/phosphatase family metal-dependent hydrolase
MQPTHRKSWLNENTLGCIEFLAKIILVYLVVYALISCTSKPPATPSRPTTTNARTPISTPNRLGDPVQVVTWNIGLDKADLHVIARRIASFSGVDLWGLQEVNSRSAPPILAAAAADGENAKFAAIQGNAGDGLHLVAMYNSDRYTLLDWWELSAINTTGNVRPSLVLHLREQSSSLEFLFMVNHLYRSREGERHKQARLLNEWAAKQSLPVIAVGDYNFDWDVTSGARQHDAGYDLMTAGDRWKWVKPVSLTTTQCSGWPCRYNSVLDFVFTAGPAQQWRSESIIIVEPGDFPDDNTTSDHRPVQATIWPVDSGVSGNSSTTTSRSSHMVVLRGAVLRSRPASGSPIRGNVRAGEFLIIVGESEDGAWLQLENGAWIAAHLVGNGPASLTRIAAPSTQRPVPTRTPPPRMLPTRNCHPSYPTVCIPPPPPDLDCPHIRERRFPVVGSDPHRFDGDGDGIGCEWD